MKSLMILQTVRDMRCFLQTAMVFVALLIVGPAAAQLQPGSGGGNVILSGPTTAGDLMVSDAVTGQILDAANAGGSAAAPLGLNINHSVVWSGSSITPNTTDLYINGGASGTCGGSNCPLNSIVMAYDTVAAPSGLVYGLQVSDYLATGATGGRAAVGAYFVFHSPSSNPSGQSYAALVAQADAQANDGGSAGTPLSQLQGANILARLNGSATATYWKYLQGGEVDLEVLSPNTILNKEGWEITELATDVVAGSGFDGALLIGNQAGAVGWLNGIVFGGGPGNWPFQTTATAINCINCGTLANFINMSGATITGNFLQSTGFTVNGNGLADAVGYEIGSTSTASTVVLGLHSSASNTLNLSVNSLDVIDILTSNNGYLGVNAANPTNSGDMLSLAGSTTTGARGATIGNIGTGAASIAALHFSTSSGTNQGEIYETGGSFSGGPGPNALVFANSGAYPIIIGANTETLKLGSGGMIVTTPASCGSLTSSTGCLKITDYNGNVIYVPTYGTI